MNTQDSNQVLELKEYRTRSNYLFLEQHNYDNGLQNIMIASYYYDVNIIMLINTENMYIQTMD